VEVLAFTIYDRTKRFEEGELPGWAVLFLATRKNRLARFEISAMEKLPGTV
jgi:hypothetical protein